MQVNLKMRERKHLENLSCGKGGKDSNGSGVASHRGKKQKSTLSECEHEQKTFEEREIPSWTWEIIHVSENVNELTQIFFFSKHYIVLHTVWPPWKPEFTVHLQVKIHAHEEGAGSMSARPWWSTS